MHLLHALPSLKESAARSPGPYISESTRFSATPGFLDPYIIESLDLGMVRFQKKQSQPQV